MRQPFHTIGHSTRSIEEFVGLLQDRSIALVADVRTLPRSRTNPQYNLETLGRSLGARGIGYEHIAALGGLRGKASEVPRALNGFWQNDSFHNYADYALSEHFRAGLERLRELGDRRRCAVMCAELLWWRCHRRIVADYLLVRGEAVFHILGSAKAEPAHLTEAARPGPSGVLTYPAPD